MTPGLAAKPSLVARQIHERWDGSEDGNQRPISRRPGQATRTTPHRHNQRKPAVTTGKLPDNHRFRGEKPPKMGTSWGPDSPHTNCADRNHGHDITTLAGVATGHQAAELERQAAELARRLELAELSAGSAHQQINQLEARFGDLTHRIGDLIVQIDGVRIMVNGITMANGEIIDALIRRISELETDRAAMIRRMRLIEEKIGFPQPGPIIMNRLGDRLPLDPAAPVARCSSCGRLAGAPTAPCAVCPDIARGLPVNLDELDDRDPREP